MSKLTGFVIFITGAAVGAAASWYYAKKKYEQIAQEEIDSVKETFKKKTNKPDIPEEPITNAEDAAAYAKEKPSVMEYAKKLSGEGYTNYSNVEEPDEEYHPSGVTGAKEGNYKPPYVIPPEEFGELFDYDTISITYYSDHILADDNDQIIEDVEDTIGFESLSHFGEYEDDSVFVRNERLKVDYEVLLDQRSYSEVIKSKPYLMED